MTARLADHSLFRASSHLYSQSVCPAVHSSTPELFFLLLMWVPAVCHQRMVRSSTQTLFAGFLSCRKNVAVISYSLLRFCGFFCFIKPFEDISPSPFVKGLWNQAARVLKSTQHCFISNLPSKAFKAAVSRRTKRSTWLVYSLQVMFAVCLSGNYDENKDHPCVVSMLPITERKQILSTTTAKGFL